MADETDYRLDEIRAWEGARPQAPHSGHRFGGHPWEGGCIHVTAQAGSGEGGTAAKSQGT